VDNRYAWGSMIWDHTYNELRNFFGKINKYQKTFMGIYDPSQKPHVMQYTVSGFLYSIKVYFIDFLFILLLKTVYY